MTPSVYLADLRYNYSGVLANDCMPLGVAYMKAVMDRDLPEVKSRLFAYPDKLWSAIADNPPDVLMLSNYVWNEALSCHIARLAKRIKPDMLVAMGGPNISIEDERQTEWLSKHPEVDVYVLGEGDFLAAEVVRCYLNAGMSLEKMLDGSIPSSVYRRSGGAPHIEKMWERHKEIDDLPSPWLTGIQDEFFDGKLAPLIETNRGCPFTCTFCVQGTRWYTKVHNFTVERMKEEVEYIARRIKELSPTQGTLRIADSNYGMYERDIEISEFIGECMKKYGYPKYIDATTGKNRPDRIIKSVEKVSGAMMLYQAVQSLDENVLRNVKRQTIKLEAYEQLLVHMRGRGLRSNSDLILGLPGETLQTHIAACHKLLDSGIHQVTNFQLMMLKGSELEKIESREMFSFKSGFRILPKNFGVYGDEKVFDVEEIVTSTDTLSFEDYLTARKLALCSVAFWHDDLFEDVFQFLSKFGLKRSECWDVFLPALEASSGEARQYLDDFVRETVGELFPTREECVEFYMRDENWARMQWGEIGDNLMHKYHAIASFCIWPAICDVAMQALKDLAIARGVDRRIPDFDSFWEDWRRFVLESHAHGGTAGEILRPSRATLTWDIAQWLADGMDTDPSAYRLEEPAAYLFALTDEGYNGLEAALQVWTTAVRGLSKMVTRINVNWQVRKCQAVSARLVEAAAV